MDVRTEIVSDSAPGWRSLAWVLHLGRAYLIARVELWWGMLQLGGRLTVDPGYRRFSLRLFLGLASLALGIAHERYGDDTDE